MVSKENSIEMIKEISDGMGISGFEDDILDLIRKHGKGLGEFKEDSLRNLYLYREGNTNSKPIVQLNAHSDEVGFMVQSIKDNGTLGIITIGGWVPSNVAAQQVWVRNGLGEYVIGIVASVPPHYLSEEEKRKGVSIGQLSIDVGARSKEEAVEKFHIRIGEPIVPKAEFAYNKKQDLMMGKAFDNRLGCVLAIDVLRSLASESLDVDLVADFSSQEEVGTRGAVVSTNTIKPDISIVLEGCPADDTFANASQTKIKQGPMLRHIDGGMITNPRFQRFALDIAKKSSLAVQEAVRAAGGTNSAAIHISSKGIPTIVIGIPVRYPHTHYGIATYFDYKNALDLTVEIIKNLNKEIISGF